MGRTWGSYLVLVDSEMVQPLWKQQSSFLENETFLPYDPAVMVLGIYSREMKTYIHTKICPQVFKTTLFLIARKWQQPKCPSVGEQINKLDYIPQ
jgi:hypothetical protein